MADRLAIMVVDDDPLVRELVGRLLADSGYPVLMAGDGEEALAMVRTLDRRLALLITDIRMPIMDGLELAAHVQRLQPGLPILFITGYTTARASELPGPVLPKPFGPALLLTSVHRLLDTLPAAPTSQPDVRPPLSGSRRSDGPAR